MISLRKLMESYQEPSKQPALDAFRSSLLAIAQCSERAVPGLGSDLNDRLNKIAASVDDAALAKATEQMRLELTSWADRALEHHHDNEREMREIIGTVANTADSLSQTSDQYARQIGSLTGRLRACADLNDFAAIRRSIIEGTEALKKCVERMTQDSRTSLHQLKSEVEEYRERLEESERVSATDPLTGLANRRAFEKKLDLRIATQRDFSLVMLDMNGFKAVNDTYGHLAGDDLLKQFATELKNQFRPADLVARWGGDEFAVIVEAKLSEARERVDGVKRWAFGEYELSAAGPPVKVNSCAAVGVVEWDGQETALQILARVDKEVYRAKATSSRSSTEPDAECP